MHGNIYCLVVNGNLVSDDIRDHLFGTGYFMMMSHQKKKRIKTHECEGLVTTKFQRQVLVDIGGVVFTAELETEKGKLKITYIVRDRDFQEMEDCEEGAWMSYDELTHGEEISSDQFRPSPIKRLKRVAINN